MEDLNLGFFPGCLLFFFQPLGKVLIGSGPERFKHYRKSFCIVFELTLKKINGVILLRKSGNGRYFSKKHR